MEVDDSSKQPSRAVHLPTLSTVSQQMHDVSIVIEEERKMEGIELSSIPWKLKYIGQMAQRHESGSFPPWNFLDLRQTQNKQWAMSQLTEGIRLAKSGCSKEAEKCYRNGLDMDPQNADILVAYGALCANLGRTTEGITKLERATQIDPQSRNAQSYLDAIRRRLMENSPQKKIPSLASRSDKAVQDAMLEKSFMTGAPNETNVKNTSHYPFVYEETKQESDEDSSTEHQKRIRRKRKEAHKKRSKRKSKYSYDSDIDDNNSDSVRRESKRRKKKRKSRRESPIFSNMEERQRKRQRESPTSSGSKERRQRKGIHQLSSYRDGETPKGHENGTQQTIQEGDTVYES